MAIEIKYTSFTYNGKEIPLTEEESNEMSRLVNTYGANDMNVMNFRNRVIRKSFVENNSFKKKENDIK